MFCHFVLVIRFRIGIGMSYISGVCELDFERGGGGEEM